jgi:hypothetical protein
MTIPFDKVMKVINASGQISLMNEINTTIAEQGKLTNQKISKLTLTALLEDNNTPAYRTMNNGLYIKYFNRAGLMDNFVGADGVTTWYKRNLYMYSMIQKIDRSKRSTHYDSVRIRPRKHDKKIH